MLRKSQAVGVTVVGVTVAVCTIAATVFAQTTSSPMTNVTLPARERQLPQYTASGDLMLPKNWREWVFVGDPLTPNALNSGKANFPEFHNVYIEPGSYAIYKKTGVFPEGTMFFKELQLTLPAENSRMDREPSPLVVAISLAPSTERM